MSLDPTQNAPGSVGQGGQDSAQGSGQGGDFDYQRGYEQLRPEYTRATQELASTREALTEYEQLFSALSDPETAAEALAALGLELAGEGPQGTGDDDFVDPLEQEVGSLKSEVAELRSARERERQAAEEAETIELRDDYIGQYMDYLERETGTTFSEREEEVLGNLAIAMADEQGLPDVQGAYDRIYGQEGVVEQRRQAWIDSKRGAFAAPLGTQIPADRKPQTRAERVQYMDERMRAFEDDRF